MPAGQTASKDSFGSWHPASSLWMPLASIVYSWTDARDACEDKAWWECRRSPDASAYTARQIASALTAEQQHQDDAEASRECHDTVTCGV
jgi:hypothetical protein